MREIWKDIKGYKDKYQVSNLGNVKSLNYNQTHKEKLLKFFQNTNGYYQIDLWKNNKGKRCLVHRLVAETFIDNPNNYPIINHKDENPLNNCAENLEWCDAKYNCNYGTRNQKLYHAVICVELNKIFESIKEASKELKIQQAHISGCCNKRKHYNTAGGYHWKYVEEVQ